MKLNESYSAWKEKRGRKTEIWVNLRKSLEHFIGNYKIRQEKKKSVGSMSEKLEMTSNYFLKIFIWIILLWMRGTAVSKAYSEPGQTSKMELFARIADCVQSFIYFLKISILDIRQGSAYASWSLTISKPLIFMLKTVFR